MGLANGPISAGATATAGWRSTSPGLLTELGTDNSRLKQLAADQVFKMVNAKKVPIRIRKRAAVEVVASMGLSKRQRVCRTLCLSRSTAYLPPLSLAQKLA
jgi:hypothetical protein